MNITILKHSGLLIFMLMLCININSQSTINGGLVADKVVGRSGTYGQVEVLESPSIDSLLNATIRKNYEEKYLEGFRIQLYSGSGPAAKQEALAKKTKFLSMFPSEKAYTVYTAPFWRVRVGDFRFRSEAQPLLNRVKVQFPGCYTVKDNTIRKDNF